MKRSKNRLLVVISISLILTAILGIVSVNAMNAKDVTKNSIFTKYTTLDESKVKSEIEKLNNNELIAEINVLSKEIDSTDLLVFANELFERKDSFSNKNILLEIKDTLNTIVMQGMLVELFVYKNENKSSQNEIKQLLKDATVTKETKAIIVAFSEFDSNDTDLLKKMISEDKGILAFRSLKQLSKSNNKEAIIISKEILSNIASESYLRISAAQKCTANFLRNSSDTNSKNNFVQQSIEIINNTKTDRRLNHSSVFALADMMSKEAIISIIKCESIEHHLKAFSIEKNYHILKEILNNKDFNENDIEVVVQAMEIIPITNLYDSLINVQDAINSNELKKRCENALQNIRLRGIEATNKWID